MARLRIRIELSRGGLGVPLHKVASVIGKSQRFLDLLGEDVHIDRSKGEWLGFDFDRESLNFTAEYVGAVTAQQVEAFNAAFDGTTSLRRDTIAQFAGITDAIGEDEIIGFGLYQTDENAEPTEWRCLSRRDALRIAEGIQLLLETDQESHLPAARDPNLGARIFGERREWSLEPGKAPDSVREVERNLSARIQRVENQVERHSGLIQDLTAHSATTETSFRNLLTTVEGFCNQATRRIEMAAPAALPAWSAEPAPKRSRRWVAATGLGVSVAIVVLFAWLLPARPAASSKNEPVESKTAAQEIKTTAQPVAAPAPGSAPVRAPVSAAVVATATAPAVTKAAAPKPVVPNSNVRIDLDATTPTWVSLIDSDGKRLLADLMVPGGPRTFQLSKDATLVTGSAGGLILKINGRPAGSLGYVGQVRQFQIKDGKLVDSPE
jgi:hypothetical protein